MDSAITSRMSHLKKIPILYGTVWALFYAVIGVLITFLFGHYGSATDGQMTIAAYIIHCLSVLFGSIAASRCKDDKGWYYGGLTGICYAVIMVLIGIVVYNTFSMDPAGLFRVLLMALIGAFGGIIGVSTVRR
jgi:putative membrane protein (TIGR04086 family)